MDEDNLYDEFGNYIGSDLSSSEGDSSSGERDGQANGAHGDGELAANGHGTNGTGGVASFAEDVEMADSTEIVLHEDKNYYASASDVYGAGVETLTMEEDTQDISEPLIKPIKQKSLNMNEKDIPKTKYDSSFMTGIMSNVSLTRNVCVAGHLHSGKTNLLDMLIEETHEDRWGLDSETRYTDSRKDEQSRGISLKSTPVSLVMQNSRSKSFLFNIIDSPGHSCFSAELSASMRLSDGVVLVVDAVEGVLMQTKHAIREASQEGAPMVLVISKFDRLILELKLPPNDCYLKFLKIIEEVNSFYNLVSGRKSGSGIHVSPQLGNVIFQSSKHRWAFTLDSFAALYAQRYKSSSGKDMNHLALAQRLWGDVYMDTATRKFRVEAIKPSDPSCERSFVAFVLNPIYKLYSHVIGEEKEAMSAVLGAAGIVLKKRDYKLDPHPLLRLVMRKFLKNSVSAIVDAMEIKIPSPDKGAHKKVVRHYRGGMSSAPSQSMLKSDPQGPLVINVVKQYPAADGSSFMCFGRIYSGTVKVGDRVRVLGEQYTVADQEDMGVATVKAISLSQARYKVDVDKASAGALVLLEGIDQTIGKTATITSVPSSGPSGTDVNEIEIFSPLNFFTIPALKVAVEPLKPSQLPKLVEGLRSVSKSFPLVTTKVEDSGEHILCGTGELHMDVALHDLRVLFSSIEVKVSDPSVAFRETVVEQSFVKLDALSPNSKNRISMIAEPVNKTLASHISSGKFDTSWGEKKMSSALRKTYGWDALASRSIWAFGPSAGDTNILLDDTLPGDVDKTLLSSVRDSVVQGFRWSTREGPLCDEPMRQVKFKVIDALVASDGIHRGAGQIIPTARRATNSAFLNASPRLMEPTLRVEIVALEDTVRSIYKIVGGRRGNIVDDYKQQGTPFRVLIAHIPAIDAYGFETDLRIRTQGQAFCMQVFDHWSLVPGDPLDDNFIVQPLEKAPTAALARDFMVKTRRRKGLGDVVVTF